MKISGLPKINTATARNPVKPRHNDRVAEVEIQPLRRHQAPEQSLVLDEHTFKDLEVFTSQGPGPSLFELCNYTSTKGGAELLKQRMHKPWSDPDCIRATQDSLRFISSQRQAFSKLPSYITQSVEKYERDILLMVSQTNSVEFLIGALALRINHERHYRNIVRGVQITATVIRQIRQFISQPALDDARGELAPLLAEMRELIAHPLFRKIPDRDIENDWSWKMLKIDQIFRFHEKASVQRLLQIVYEVDALVSMADATSKLNLTLPEIGQGMARVEAENLRHPMLENAVANPVSLDQSKRVMFLTGPNMAGKTTYIRAFAIALYLAHLGMGVPASRFCFTPVQRLYSSISLNDDLHSGVSYFRAEALRIKTIAEAIADGFRVAAVMDEPFKGTNIKDAFDVSLQVLKRLADKPDCIFMFSSHLIELDDEFAQQDSISRYHFEAQEDQGRLVFDFLLRPGISSQRLGVRVLEEEGVFNILDRQAIQ